ncbi:MAG: phenylalanine--tRNA ligase subunit beta, partial [Bacteroidetes bacterium HGW-Bacteroidetes-22]
MKISYNWLKKYINIETISIEKLSELLTNCGLEVEGYETIESIKGGLKGLVIGEIIFKEKHPDADRLSVTKVKINENEPLLNIVCGAPNVAEGQKVVVAPVGCTIYPLEGEPFKINKSKIRGQVSEGMICAEDEIGLGKSHDGIMVLNGDATIGKLASDFFGVETDVIFEIGLTPNR